MSQHKAKARRFVPGAKRQFFFPYGQIRVPERVTRFEVRSVGFVRNEVVFGFQLSMPGLALVMHKLGERIVKNTVPALACSQADIHIASSQYKVFVEPLQSVENVPAHHHTCTSYREIVPVPSRASEECE